MNDITPKEASEILSHYTDLGYGIVIEGDDVSKIKQALSLASKMLANGTPYNDCGDLISKNEVKELGATCLARRNEDGQLEAIISLDLAPTVEQSYQMPKDYIKNRLDYSRPQGDLIKRNLAISYATSGLVRRIDGENWIRTSEVKQSLNDVPTVDLWQMRQEATENALKKAEVLYGRPEGEWIDQMADKGYVECPFCHKQITGGDLNFCVKCGADMRKGGAE